MSKETMEFQSKVNPEQYQESGEVMAKSPSNIALVKYWGKYEHQIPANPSISFTLSKSYTKTTLKFKKKETLSFDIQVFLNGEKKESFTPKVLQFFERVQSFIPFLNHFSFEVHTENSFPHSSGIASSASGMSALSLCLMKMEQYFGADLSNFALLKKASFLARLGSGSASRSIYPNLVIWGKHKSIPLSSDFYAVPFSRKVSPVFHHFHDVILLVHKGVKEVSSTVGHKLMENHPYAKVRFEEAHRNLEKIIPILEEGNLEEFGRIVEHEALSLHAMMMVSNPAFILMQPNTLAILHKVWEFRKHSNAHLYFTLDAGANVHLLFPEQDAVLAIDFIKNDLAKYCENGTYIHDKVDTNFFS